MLNPVILKGDETQFIWKEPFGFIFAINWRPMRVTGRAFGRKRQIQMIDNPVHDDMICKESDDLHQTPHFGQRFAVLDEASELGQVMGSTS